MREKYRARLRATVLIMGLVAAAGAAAGERYDGMPQDELGVATFPNGDKVAWFLDPDGNILSVAELVA